MALEQTLITALLVKKKIDFAQSSDNRLDQGFETIFGQLKNKFCNVVPVAVQDAPHDPHMPITENHKNCAMCKPFSKGAAD